MQVTADRWAGRCVNRVPQQVMSEGRPVQQARRVGFLSCRQHLPFVESGHLRETSRVRVVTKHRNRLQYPLGELTQARGAAADDIPDRLSCRQFTVITGKPVDRRAPLLIFQPQDACLEQTAMSLQREPRDASGKLVLPACATIRWNRPFLS